MCKCICVAMLYTVSDVSQATKNYQDVLTWDLLNMCIYWHFKKKSENYTKETYKLTFYFFVPPMLSFSVPLALNLKLQTQVV